MADFCNQCATKLGFPTGDLASSERQPPPPNMGYPDLCEGCGPCMVDHLGNCTDPCCIEKHGVKAKAAEIQAAFLKKVTENTEWHRPCNMPLVVLNDVARELCGELYTFKIVQQIHDEYIVEVTFKEVKS